MAISIEKILSSWRLAALFAAAVALTGCDAGFKAAKNAKSVRPAGSVSVNPGDNLTTPDTPISGTSVPTLTSWNDTFPAPARVDNCLTNSSYNVCLTIKDPVTTYGSSFAPVFSPTTATLAQETATFIYGLKIPTTGALSNQHFQMISSGYTEVRPTSAGDWKHRLNGDTNHNVSQIHAWYWVNRQRADTIERTGTFHFSSDVMGVKGKIQAYDSTQDFNAYFDYSDYSIHMGFGSNNASIKEEGALDLSILAHEVGHGNFTAAAPNAYNNDTLTKACTQSPNDYCCPTKDGCLSAMDEGLADVHAAFLFRNHDPTFFSYFYNTLTGDSLRNLKNIESSGTTAQTLYNSFNGEIHDLGTVYASIWYGVWKKARARGTEKQIESLFSEHLSVIDGADTFLTAYTPIKTLIDTLFPAQAALIKNDFKTEYARMGLTVN